MEEDVCYIYGGPNVSVLAFNPITSAKWLLARDFIAITAAYDEKERRWERTLEAIPGTLFQPVLTKVHWRLASPAGKR